MSHEIFHYRTSDDLRERVRGLGAFLPLSEDFSALFVPLELAGKTVANRIAFQPMEGTDGTPEGAPAL